jgi:hypothetical protein
MADDSKISINVNIDDQNSISKYINAFSNLRTAVNNLSQPLNSFSKDVNSLNGNLLKYNESLSKLSEQHENLRSTGEKPHEKVSEMTTSFAAGIGILDVFRIALKGLTVGLTAGLSVVIAFLPEIINFAKALFTGKDALDAMVTNFKNLNEVMKISNKDASSEATRLQILYRSATDVNNAHLNRIKSVKELQKEFPAYFKGLKHEAY